MNTEEIIDMARQAGFRVGPSRDGPDEVRGAGVNLEWFAKLVDAKATAREREACDAICKDAYEWAEKKLNQTTNAKEDSHWAGRIRQAQDIGNAIRNRGDL